MATYVTRRILYAAITFVGITIATFSLIHMVPGDPVSFYVGRAGSHGVPEATLAAIRHEFHLDLPLSAQYLHWVRSAAMLDFGDSVLHRRPVRDVVLEKLPNTFALNLLALLLAVAVGIPSGLWAASVAGSLRDTVTSGLTFLLYSLPAFWVALLLIQVVSVHFGLLPLFGMHSDGYEELGFFAQLLDRTRYLILPVITLAYAQVAIFTRFSRAAILEVIGQDFILAARARGATPRTLLWGHALRNAFIPLISLLGLSIPYLLSGSVVVEQIYQWDGLGLLYYDAILARDYPVVMGLTVVTALATLGASIVADLLYVIADPRLRLKGGVAP
jgi:peptide/nickel transport system permease protein